MNDDGKLTNGDIPESLWRDMRAKYVKTDCSYRQLSDDFSVSFHTLAKRAKEEDWRKLRAEFRATNLRKQRAAMMRAKIESAEEDAACRYRFAVWAKRLGVAAMERFEALRMHSTVGSRTLYELTSTIRRCQEIEFAARGMNLDTTQVNAVHYGSWNEYLKAVREEKQLPDKPSPFGNAEE